MLAVMVTALHGITGPHGSGFLPTMVVIGLMEMVLSQHQETCYLRIIWQVALNVWVMKVILQLMRMT